MSKTSRDTTAFQSVLAGGMAGGVESVITYPTEYIKTKQQLASKTLIRTSPFRILLNVVRQEGVHTLYTGASAFCVSNTLKSAVRFTSFDLVRRQLGKDPATGRISPVSNMFAGLCAGVMESTTVLTPGENIKTRMIQGRTSTGSNQYSSTWNAISKTLSADGITGLWRGVVPVSLKQSANAVVRFTSYQFFLERAQEALSGRSPALATAVSGAAAGIVTVYCTMPFDVAKTKMQAGKRGEYRGTVDCIRSTIHSDGIQVLWKGTTPRLMRLSVSGMISFSIYEQVIAWTGAWGGEIQGAPSGNVAGIGF